ncbi:MAG TPA: dethiobiotin synthase [Candidatus Baltobacteraceae bacterium]|nr:dethiobiotin synthase [Candidatus Baltobacteraceae bacterium]
MSLFITGTDTGVGKTHTAVQLLRLLRAAGISCAGMKPICCGDRRDAELLLAAGSDGLTIDEVNPVWLETPAAPIVGSLMEEVKIDIVQILAAFRALQGRVEHVIVEGVGGWLVPIRSDYFVSDLAVEMQSPVLVVAQNRLGCLNHTALTLRSVAQHKLRCVGVALNDVPVSDDIAALTNADILGKIVNVPLLGGLGKTLMELPADWRLMIESTRKP